MKRVWAIAACVELGLIATVLHSQIKDFLFVHTWLFSALCAAPALTIALLEWKHSGEANDLREEANTLQVQANQLRERANEYYDQANKYRAEANAESARANEALRRIAEHTKKAPTKAERNTERLGAYLRKTASVVNADGSSWGSPAEIVEIKDDIATLFCPAGFTSSSAFAVWVCCEDLEMIEGVGGLTIKILKRYGTEQNLGDIRTWEQRQDPPSAPRFSKGPNVFSAAYAKPGSADRRTLSVFESADGSNSYVLEASSGQVRYGNNVEISRHFMLIQVELEAEGFRWNSGSSGGSKRELLIRTHT